MTANFDIILRELNGELNGELKGELKGELNWTNDLQTLFIHCCCLLWGWRGLWGWGDEGFPEGVELGGGELVAELVELVEFEDGVAEVVAHDVAALDGEMDIVVAGEAFLMPDNHGVESTHSVVDAPVGGAMLVGHGVEFFDDGGEFGVCSQLAADHGAHVRGADEEDDRVGAGLTDMVDLFAEAFAVGVDDLVGVEIRHRVAAELHDNQRGVDETVGLSQLFDRHHLELMSRCRTHADIVDSNARAVVYEDTIDVG